MHGHTRSTILCCVNTVKRGEWSCAPSLAPLEGNTDTYEFGRFVLSAVHDSLEAFSHNSLEEGTDFEGLLNDPVDFSLEFQQLLDHRLLPLHVTHYGHP